MLWFIFVRRKALNSRSFQVIKSYCVKSKWPHKFHLHFLYYFHNMNHYNSSDCKILHVNTCCLGKFPLAQIPTYTITNAVNFNWQFKLLMVMSFSNILKTLVSFRKWVGNFPITGKNQTVMLQQAYEGLRMTVSLITVSSSFFFCIKLDTFIQIFLGL